jgi:cyclin-dependent kinase 12/13
MIYKLCGSPPEDYLTKMKLKTSFRPPHRYKASFEENFKDFPSSALNLLTTLLDLDPQLRGTAASALESQVSSSIVAFMLITIDLFHLISILCHRINI